MEVHNDPLWQKALEETFTGPGDLGDEGAVPVSSREEVQGLLEGIDSGAIKYDALPDEAKRGVDMARSAYDRYSQLASEGTPGASTGQEQRFLQSDTGAPSPIPEAQPKPVKDGYFPDQKGYVVFSEDELLQQKRGLTDSQALSGPVMKAAVMKAMNNGVSIAEAAQQALANYSETGNPEVAFQAETDTAIDKDTEEVMNSFRGTDMFQDPEAVEEQVAITQEAIRQMREEGKDPDFVFWSMVADPGVREETVKRIAAEHKFRELAAKTWDDMSKADVFFGFMRDFLLPLNFYDNIRISGSAFNAEEYLNNVVNNVRSMSPEEQEQMVPIVQEWVSDNLPSLKQMSLYSAFASPEYSRDLEDFSKEWALFDAAELAFMGATVATAVVKLNQARKVAKDMKNLGMKAEVAEGVAAAAVAKSDEAVKMLGMDDKSLANTLSPFATEIADPNSIDNISKMSYDNIVEFERRNKAWEERARSEQDILREGAFSEDQRKALEQDKINKFLKEYSVQDGLVTERRRDGFSFEYEGFDEDGNSLGRMTQDFKFTLDDASAWEVDTIGMASQYVLSPLSMFKSKDTRDLARQAQRLDNVQAKMLNEMRWLYRDALKSVTGDTGLKVFTPGTRKKLADLDFILLKGDQEKAVYSVDQLKSGVLGVKLKDDQVEAYYKVRSLLDTLGRVREDGMRREKLLRGERGVLIGDKHLSGKVYVNASDAASSLNDSNRKFIYHETDGNILKEELSLADAYQEGFSLVRLGEPMDLAGDGNKVFYALVKSDNVTDLPENLLNIRPGYVPKINEQAAYFVREHVAHTVDGTPILASDTRASSKAIRAFARKEEADEFVRVMTEKAAKEGKTIDQVRYERYEDRELEKTRAISTMGDEHQLGRPGSLFTGARAEELLWGVEGIEAPRVDSFTAVSHYIANLSRYSARNEWRLGMEAAALKTANQLEGRGNRVYKSFDQLKEAPVDTESGIIIRALHRQIEEWMNWPTADELWFGHAVQKIIDSSFGKKMEVAHGALFNLKQKDPTAAMRAAAFHGLLGWFNPVQLWVQAQGAAVAASMNILRPDKLALALKDQGVLRVIQGTLKTDEQIKRGAKAFGNNPERTLELVRAWERSGLEDSVLATADHSAALRGRGVALDAISRAADKGLMFYREGELFNRRFSFSTAFEEWKMANKGKELTDDDLRGIIDRSHNLMLNMSKGNRARWQRGILGTSTQFQQVSAKTVESLLGLNGNFTGKERTKIFMGQMALYGGAGIPLGTMGSQWAAEMLGYDSISDVEENMSPGTVKALNEGFLGWMTLMLFDVDVDIGNRSSLWNGIENIADSILYGEGNMVANMLGAFTGPAGGFWKAMVGDYAPLSLTVAQDRPLAITNLATNPLIGSISFFKNVDKALFMDRMGVILNTNMDPVVIGPFDWRESLAVAMGFKLVKEREVYDLRKQNKISDEYRSKVVKEIVRINYQAAQWGNSDEGLTDQRHKWIEEATAALIQSVDGNWQQLEVIKAVEQKLRDSKKDPRAIEYHKWRERQAEDKVNFIQSIRRELNTSGIYQQGLYQEGEE